MLQGEAYLSRIELPVKRARGDDATRGSLESDGGDICLTADSTQTRLSWLRFMSMVTNLISQHPSIFLSLSLLVSFSRWIKSLPYNIVAGRILVSQRLSSALGM